MIKIYFMKKRILIKKYALLYCCLAYKFVKCLQNRNEIPQKTKHRNKHDITILLQHTYSE